MNPARLLTSLTLAIWLGIYAFRAFVSAAVWNLSDELPLHLKPVLALGTEAIAVIGALLIIKWRRRLLQPLAIALALITVARQIFVSADAIGPWLSVLSWPLWLWFMAALADEVAANDGDALIATACALAVALQIGMQTAWHGLDLSMVSGWLSVLVSVVLVSALLFNVQRIETQALQRPHTSVAWLLLGPALFLEITLTGNLGRFGQISGMPLLAVGVVLQISLLLAVVVANRFTGFPFRVMLIVLGFVALFAIPELRGAAGLILLSVQLVVISGLREAADRRLRISAATAFTAGALIHFLLIFAFYNAYELPPLWIVTFAAFTIMAGLAQRSGVWPRAQITTAFAAASAIAVLFLIPPPPAPERDPASLAVMTYNIHHGFNDDGVPGMQRTANEIARLNPDIIAIQEIGRGWNMLGGNDLVGYLRWRFPDYRIDFVALNGQLWGNAIMSRLPVDVAKGETFETAPGVFKYGWIGATINYAGQRLVFYSVHITSDLDGPMGDERVAQVEALQHLTLRKSPLIVAGDFNAHPEDPPMQVFRQMLTDLGAQAGLAEVNTWPAVRSNERIDYIFGRGITAVSGAVPATTASDHLPVLMRVRLGDKPR